MRSAPQREMIHLQNERLQQPAGTFDLDYSRLAPLSQLLNVRLPNRSSDKENIFPKQLDRNCQTNQISANSLGKANTASCGKLQKNPSSLPQQISSSNISTKQTYSAVPLSSSGCMSSAFCRKYFQNGEYYGQLHRDRPNGEGAFFWDNGCFYYGQWERGLMEGCGLLIFKTGNLLRGYFSNGKAHGLAEISFSSISSQQGVHKLNGIWDQGVFLQQSSFSSQSPPLQALEDPYFYDNELKKQLMYYSAGPCGLEVGERKYEELNGLGVKFFFDGKIECGSYKVVQKNKKKLYYARIIASHANLLIVNAFAKKRGLLEGRGKAMFKGGDIFDGIFFNSTFQGPGIFYTAIEKQWAYGAFSRNKIMYIQQQNNSYPPPALYDLRGKDQNIDEDDRLLGESLVRDTMMIECQVLCEETLLRANGVIRTEETTICFDEFDERFDRNEELRFQNEEEMLDEDEFLNSPTIGKLKGEKIRDGQDVDCLIPSLHEDIFNHVNLRKTADFGATIKNLSAGIADHSARQFETTMNKTNNNSSYNQQTVSIGSSSLTEKTVQSYIHHANASITPKKAIPYGNSLLIHPSSIIEKAEIYYPEAEKCYYGISDETYQVIHEMNQSNILSKQRNKSIEKISKLQSMITGYLHNDQINFSKLIPSQPCSNRFGNSNQHNRAQSNPSTPKINKQQHLSGQFSKCESKTKPSGLMPNNRNDSNQNKVIFNRRASLGQFPSKQQLMLGGQMSHSKNLQRKESKISKSSNNLNKRSSSHLSPSPNLRQVQFPNDFQNASLLTPQFDQMHNDYHHISHQYSQIPLHQQQQQHNFSSLTLTPGSSISNNKSNNHNNSSQHYPPQNQAPNNISEWNQMRVFNKEKIKNDIYTHQKRISSGFKVIPGNHESKHKPRESSSNCSSNIQLSSNQETKLKSNKQNEVNYSQMKSNPSGVQLKSRFIDQNRCLQDSPSFFFSSQPQKVIQHKRTTSAISYNSTTSNSSQNNRSSHRMKQRSIGIPSSQQAI